MSRITIMLDEDNMKMARKYQADMIKKTDGAYSFSRCINDLLKENKK